MSGKPIEFYVDENGCHICTSHKQKKLDNGKQVHIHHYVYVTKTGKEIPKGMIVAHKCGNKKCINFEHLTLATRSEATTTRLSRPLSYEVDPVTGCHNCTSHKPNAQGYPQIKVDGKKMRAHKFVYEREHGKVPPGLVVRHKCDNRRCINPEHLELGTQGDNIRDMVERDRQPKGSERPSAKLTEEDVREIRKRLYAGETTCRLAEEYGVSQSVISEIKNWKKWKHVV